MQTCLVELRARKFVRVVPGAQCLTNVNQLVFKALTALRPRCAFAMCQLGVYH